MKKLFFLTIACIFSLNAANIAFVGVNVKALGIGLKTSISLDIGNDEKVDVNKKKLNNYDYVQKPSKIEVFGSPKNFKY